MNKRFALILGFSLLLAVPAVAQDHPPLKLVRTLEMPGDLHGNFDHFAVDVAGRRLFSCAERYKAVVVFDTRTGKIVHTMEGIEIPHAILYRGHLGRIYVTDGGAGELKIFDSKSYKLIKAIKLLKDSDSIGYDPAPKYLYVDNGGGDVHETYSMISVIDTTKMQKLADMKIDGDTLEALALERSGSRMFVNNRAKNQISVIDRKTRELIASWPVTLAKFNVAMALDEAHHRLFVGCRSGAIVVFDTRTGEELRALPISQGVDDMVFDPQSKRIYASCGAGDGSVDVYEETDPDHYQLLGKVPSGHMGKTALLVPALHRYFVAVPQNGSTNAKVLEYEVQ